LSTKKLRPSVLETAMAGGIHIHDLDFIRIRKHVSPETAQALADCRDQIVFTSSHAVQAFALNLKESGLTAQTQQVFCLAGKTLNAVRRLLNPKKICVAGDAFSLAQLILDTGPTAPLSFVCGSRRRDELPELLKKHDIVLREVHVYDTLIEPKPVRLAYEGVLFFSPSGVEAFFQVNVLREGIVCFSVGATTANELRRLTNNSVIVAAQTSQESVLDSVINYFGQTKSK